MEAGWGRPVGFPGIAVRSKMRALQSPGQLGIPGIAPVATAAAAAGGGEGSSRINNRVVVVGGGVAGALLAKNMQFHADVVLIDPQKIKSSRSVLIIGGGPTGVELAGEIAVDYPEKKVTLVHKGSRLLELIGPKASKKAMDWLSSKNVEVLLGQSIDLDSISEADGVYTTSAGEKITADCHFVCVAKPLGSSWLQESVLEDSLDKKGRLLVDEKLRVRGHKNIFAIGDIADVPVKSGF